MAALTTPFDLTNRGLTANAGVTSSLYPHSQQVNETGVKVRSAYFNAVDAIKVKTNNVSTDSTIAANDVFQLLTIPAGSFVLGVTAQVTTVEGGACTFDIGDGATADGYHDGLDGNAATDVFSFDEDGTKTEAFGNGKYYAAADTIDLKFMTGTCTVLSVKVSVAYIQLKPYTNA